MIEDNQEAEESPVMECQAQGALIKSHHEQVVCSLRKLEDAIREDRSDKEERIRILEKAHATQKGWTAAIAAFVAVAISFITGRIGQ